MTPGKLDPGNPVGNQGVSHAMIASPEMAPPETRPSMGRGALGLLLAPLLVSGCVEDSSTDPPSAPPPAQVIVRTTDQLRFMEPEVVIRAGGTVHWRSDSFMTHSIHPQNEGDWEPVEQSGQGGAPMLSVTFHEPGAYHYYCQYHVGSGMTGVVFVEP